MSLFSKWSSVIFFIAIASIVFSKTYQTANILVSSTVEIEEKLVTRLKHHVNHLAASIGERPAGAGNNRQAFNNSVVIHSSISKRQLATQPVNLDLAAEYIFKNLVDELGLGLGQGQGQPRVKQQIYLSSGIQYRNIYVDFGESNNSSETIILAAHYDSVKGSFGADDNASGVAVLIELIRFLNKETLHKNVTIAFFPYQEAANNTEVALALPRMGSYQFAKRMKLYRKKIRFMVSLDMVGFIHEQAKQRYPTVELQKKHPKVGNFIALMGLPATAKEMDYFFAKLNNNSIAVEKIVVDSIFKIAMVSDHRSFLKFGFPAFMLTDTMFYRNLNYHRRRDKPSTLNYTQMSRLTKSLVKAILEVENENPQ